MTTSVVELPDRRLTDHFRLREFTVSKSHPELVEPVPQEYMHNVELLAMTILEPIRREIGRPIIIDSGYRSPALNAALPGSSPSSQHLRAEAADWTTSRLREVFRSLLGRANKLPTGQVIYYPDRNFVHIALPCAKYPSPSFHLHWPVRGLQYRHLVSVGQLDRLLA